MDTNDSANKIMSCVTKYKAWAGESTNSNNGSLYTLPRYSETCLRTKLSLEG